MDTTPLELAKKLYNKNKGATILEITQWAVSHPGFTEPDIVRHVIEQYHMIQARVAEPVGGTEYDGHDGVAS